MFISGKGSSLPYLDRKHSQGEIEGLSAHTQLDLLFKEINIPIHYSKRLKMPTRTFSIAS